MIIRNIKILFICLLLAPLFLSAQVAAVQYGKNRIQYKKFKWKFYQSLNTNVYVTQGGMDLGKNIVQIAEQELPKLEKFIEYTIHRKIEFVVYNSFDEYKQSNIGLGMDWQSAGGLTKLVNNKVVLYFDGNHEHLKLQIRQGIAKVLFDNLMFGDDIGEIASNQTLLDLPQWLTDGYIMYAAQNWNTAKDDELRDLILAGDYDNFYKFAFQKPTIAGPAFWYYIEEKYGKENITYFMYLAHLNKSLNKASKKICKKKFKEVLNDFWEFEQDKYYKDMRLRRNAPKGSMSVMEDVSENDYFRFQANPNPRNNNYAVVEYKKGKYSVKYIENFYDVKVLLTKGIKTKQNQENPNYPIIAWDGKGTKLLVIYWEAGKIKMFVYDIIEHYKTVNQELTGFDQILDASFMLDANNLILSAVKNGHSDIFTYKIQEDQVEQITNDVYDDLNPTFVSFPNRSGIIFSSNRPGNNAPNNDTILPSKYKFNIYLVDILNKSSVKQITQLSNVKHGNAMYPMQYNTNHFTYVSDENGISNRWAGFFSTHRNGLDTLYFVGDEMLHNATPKDLDSTLKAWKKTEPDSVRYFQVYADSTYTFPITNYQTSLLETRIAGNNGQVSETRRDGDFKMLYKLKINEDALNQRNINARPTEYMKRVLEEEKIAEGKATNYQKKGKDSSYKKPIIIFQSDFADEKPDTVNTRTAKELAAINVLDKTKLFNYKRKFAANYVMSGFNNSIMVNRYQTYTGGYGPIIPGNGSDMNFDLNLGTSDIMEDTKITGGYKFAFNPNPLNLSINFTDADYFFSYQNYRRRIDWGITYYRSTQTDYPTDPLPFVDNSGNGFLFNVANRLYTNLYQFNASYPFDEVNSIRTTIALRSDKIVTRPYAYTFNGQQPVTGLLHFKDSTTNYGLTHLEFVHDNTLELAQNLWYGLKYKIYIDADLPANFNAFKKGNYTFNFGFDARNSFKIYRNFIWATRASGDFSWGTKKIIYYLGGADGWFMPKFNNNHQPAADQEYAYQALAVNMRGYDQNIANGNNAVVINSELRFPLLTSILNTPINNAFLRNFQIVQFLDLGTAWNGKYNGITRPTDTYYNNPLTVTIDAGGLGPFAAGYGFGFRSQLLGYFMKLDYGWPMKGFFMGSPKVYFSLGLDF